MELICSSSLAARLGALKPATIEMHREMKNAGHLLVRDPASSQALFWPLQPGVGQLASRSS